MKIGIDGSMFTQYKFGIGHYVASILEAMVGMRSDVEYFLYTNSSVQFLKDYKNFKVNVIKPYGGPLWLQINLPKRLYLDKVDLYWGGNYALPLYPGRVKKVITVHDLVYKRYPDTLPARTVKHLNMAMPFYLRCADHVIVDSENTACDLREFYSFPQDKLSVVPLAARYDFFIEQEVPIIENIMQKYNLQQGYLLFVGTVEPRKGITTILEALSIYKHKKGYCPKLVIVGKFGWKTEKIISVLEKLSLGDSVKFLNYVEDADLPALYQGASLFIYPSIYEGFGLPVLEAMASGLPVITSNVSSLPEVGGEAALYVEPGNASMMAILIEKVLYKDSFREELKKKGLNRAQLFSWQHTAEQTMSVFENVMKKV